MMNNSRIHYVTCPVCDSNSLREVFAAKDHMVSGEEFLLVECARCGLRLTQDIPDARGIGSYYFSEDYVSHSDTRKGMINRLYHLVRKRTLSGKFIMVEKETGIRNGRLLDIGAGTGAFVQRMIDGGWDASGTEPDEKARKRALEVNNVTLMPGEAVGKLEEGSFDAITLWHVLEHVHNLHEEMSTLKKLLKEKGRLFVAVPNYTSTDATHYGKYWAAYDVPRHLYHFSPFSVKALLAAQGMALAAIRPMWYDSFYISLLSEKYKYGKSRPLQAFTQGLRSNLHALIKKDRCSSLVYVIGKRA